MCANFSEVEQFFDERKVFCFQSLFQILTKILGKNTSRSDRLHQESQFSQNVSWKHCNCCGCGDPEHGQGFDRPRSRSTRCRVWLRHLKCPMCRSSHPLNDLPHRRGLEDELKVLDGVSADHGKLKQPENPA